VVFGFYLHGRARVSTRLTRYATSDGANSLSASEVEIRMEVRQWPDT
jgi:hypothetical protein